MAGGPPPAPGGAAPSGSRARLGRRRRRLGERGAERNGYSTFENATHRASAPALLAVNQTRAGGGAREIALRAPSSASTGARRALQKRGGLLNSRKPLPREDFPRDSSGASELLGTCARSAFARPPNHEHVAAGSRAGGVAWFCRNEIQTNCLGKMSPAMKAGAIYPLVSLGR